MRVGPYDFRPDLLPTLAALLFLAGFIGLGLWQLDRANTKKAWETAYLSRRALPPVALAGAPTGAKDRRYLGVQARGHYDQAHQYLLDNQVHHGQAGYLVLTPFLMEQDQRAILVARGWVPLGNTRADLPALPVDGGTRSIQGLLAPPPAAGLVLGPAKDGTEGWPQVIERARAAGDFGPPRAGPAAGLAAAGSRAAGRLCARMDAAHPGAGASYRLCGPVVCHGRRAGPDLPAAQFAAPSDRQERARGWVRTLRNGTSCPHRLKPRCPDLRTVLRAL